MDIIYDKLNWIFIKLGLQKSLQIHVIKMLKNSFNFK